METTGRRIAERKSQGLSTEARKKETQGETKRKAEAVNEEDVNPRKKAERQRDSREHWERSTQVPKRRKSKKTQGATSHGDK